jgi:hypothetical protein
MSNTDTEYCFTATACGVFQSFCHCIKILLILDIKPSKQNVMAESFNIPELYLSTTVPGPQVYSGAHTIEFWVYVLNKKLIKGMIQKANPNNTDANFLFRINNQSTSNGFLMDMRVFITIDLSMTTVGAACSFNTISVKPTSNTLSLSGWNFISCGYDATIGSSSFGGSTAYLNNLSMVVNSNSISSFNQFSWNSNISNTFIFTSNFSALFVFKNISIFNYLRPAAMSMNQSRNTPPNSIAFFDPSRASISPTFGFALQAHFPLKMTAGMGVYDSSWSAPNEINQNETYLATSGYKKGDLSTFAYLNEFWKDDVDPTTIFGQYDRMYSVKRRQVPNIDFNNKPFVLCYGDMRYDSSSLNCKNVQYREYLQNVVTSNGNPALTISNFKLPDKTTSNMIQVMEEGSFTITFWVKFNLAAVGAKNGLDIFFGDYVAAGLSVNSPTSIRHHLFLWPNHYKTPADGIQRYQKVYTDETITSASEVWLYYIATVNSYQNAIYLGKNFTQFSLLGHLSSFTSTGTFSVKARNSTKGEFVFVKEIKFWIRYANFMHKLRRYDPIHLNQLILYLPLEDSLADYSSSGWTVSADSAIYSWRKTLTDTGYTSSSPSEVFAHCGANEVWMKTCTCKTLLILS